MAVHGTTGLCLKLHALGTLTSLSWPNCMAAEATHHTQEGSDDEHDELDE
jgi:hypothetical protein